MLPRQIRVQEPKGVGRFDHPDALPVLRLGNLLVQSLHLGPVQLWPEMVLGVVSVVKPEQIIQFVIRAYTPGNRLVRVAAIVKEIAVQVGTAVPQIIEGEEEKPEFPVQIKADGDRGSQNYY